MPEADDAARQQKQQQLRDVEFEIEAMQQRRDQMKAEVKSLTKQNKSLQANAMAKQAKELNSQRNELKRVKAALKLELLEAPPMSDLPHNALHLILVDTVRTTDLLAHVSTCATVCSQWRQVLAAAPAFGLRIGANATVAPAKTVINPDSLWTKWTCGQRCYYQRATDLEPTLTPPAEGVKNQKEKADEEGFEKLWTTLLKRRERRRVLLLIARQLRQGPPHSVKGRLSLAGERIGAEAGRLLSACLRALPPPIPLTHLDLQANELNFASAVPLAEALRRGFAAGQLRVLRLSNNPEIGDDGLRLLGVALPTTLSEVALENIGGGDDGLIELARRLPSLSCFARHSSHGAILRCGGNHAMGEDSFRRFSECLPAIPALSELSFDCCSGMGDSGAILLAEGLRELADCGAALNKLSLDHCGIGEKGLRTLSKSLPPSLAVLSLAGNDFSTSLRELKVACGKSMRLKLRLHDL